MPETSETVALQSVLLLEPTDNDEVDELTPDKGNLTGERCARPVSKSEVHIPAAVKAEALVANVASHATTVSPAAWLLLLSSGDARSTTCCKLQLDIRLNVIFIALVRLLKVTHAKVMVPETFEVFVVSTVLLVEPTDIGGVDELSPDNAGSQMSATARPPSKSVVLIPADALAAALVARVASPATSVSSAATAVV